MGGCASTTREVCAAPFNPQLPLLALRCFTSSLVRTVLGKLMQIAIVAETEGA